MILHIKNMVCDRCIMVVRQLLENEQLFVSDIDLGTAIVLPEPNDKQLQQLSAALKNLGFEILDKEKNQVTERIKNIVIELVHYSDLRELRQSFTTVISGRLKKDYAYLSRLFSDVEDITIEKFIILQKIEKVKALIQDEELTLNEIAWTMDYSSMPHLSGQFRAVTGLSTREFKALTIKGRKPLDKI